MSEPKLRTINKQDATRRLIHSAIRMFMEEEDPLAIHLLVQSADKLLIDVAKQLGKELKLDWELYIKDEFRPEFFTKHRAIYNYLKHAKGDFDKELVVEDIMTRNLMDMFGVIVNFFAVYNFKTNYMVLFQFFILTIYPKLVIGPDTIMAAIQEAAYNFTPREFFKLMEQNQSVSVAQEFIHDRRVVGDFYTLTPDEIRRGVKQNPRKLTLPRALFDNPDSTPGYESGGD